ncbi:MAG: hypothetical protein H7X71_06165, partial [Chitinophagales bacterium]|nr:hypothetical protein [Chitinophagales bacterium]
MLKCLQSGFCIFLFASGYAQNFQYDVALKEVVYAGDGMYTIHEDDSYAYLDDVIHWKDDGTMNPAAFWSGSVMQATAQLQLACDEMP